MPKLYLCIKEIYAESTCPAQTRGTDQNVTR